MSRGDGEVERALEGARQPPPLIHLRRRSHLARFFTRFLSISTFSTKLLLCYCLQCQLTRVFVRSAWTGSSSGKQLIHREGPPGRQNL